MVWSVLFLAVFNIFMGLTLKTNDLKSSIFFKFIPFIFGLLTIFFCLKDLKFI